MIIYPVFQLDPSREVSLIVSIIDSNSKLTPDKWKLSILRNNDNALILLESVDNHGRVIESIKSDLSEHGLRTYGVMCDSVFTGFVGKFYLGSNYLTSVDITTSQKEELSSYVSRFNQVANFGVKPSNNAYIEVIKMSLGDSVIRALSLDLPEFSLYMRVSRKIDNWLLLGKTFEEASSLNDREYQTNIANIALMVDDHERRISKMEESLLHRFNVDTKNEQN